MTKRKNIWQQTNFLSIIQLQLRLNFPMKRTGRLFHTSVTSHKSNFVFQSSYTSFSLHEKTKTISHHLCSAAEQSDIQAQHSTAQVEQMTLCLSYCLRLRPHRPARSVLLIDSRVDPTCGDPTAEIKTSSGSRQPPVVCGWMQCAAALVNAIQWFRSVGSNPTQRRRSARRICKYVYVLAGTWAMAGDPSMAAIKTTSLPARPPARRPPSLRGRSRSVACFGTWQRAEHMLARLTCMAASLLLQRLMHGDRHE